MEGVGGIGELIVWDAGEAQISISENFDENVFEEHRVFGSVQEVLVKLAEIEAHVIGG